jgi:hypothetical protein
MMQWFHTNHATGETIEQYAKRMAELYCNIKAQGRVPTLHADPIGLLNSRFLGSQEDIIEDAIFVTITCPECGNDLMSEACRCHKYDDFD